LPVWGVIWPSLFEWGSKNWNLFKG
jgi:hypothetical protein